MKEISAEELEAACRKCVRVEVSDTKTLVRVLDKMKKDYEIRSDTEALIYGDLALSELVMELAKENCMPAQICNFLSNSMPCFISDSFSSLTKLLL